MPEEKTKTNIKTGLIAKIKNKTFLRPILSEIVPERKVPTAPDS